MKNQLEPWEEGLAGRMKEHEFSFDPAAMAGFESLLAAETAVAGETAPGDPAAPTASSGLFTGKILGLALGVLLAGSLLLFAYSGEEELTPEPVTTEVEPAPPATPETTAEVIPQAPSTTSGEALPETNTPTTLTKVVGQSTITAEPKQVEEWFPTAVPPAPTVVRETNHQPAAAAMDLPRPMPTSGVRQTTGRSRRAIAVPVLVTPRQGELIAPLRLRPLPQVTITLEPAQSFRDRKALFPEVIDQQ